MSWIDLLAVGGLFIWCCVVNKRLSAMERELDWQGMVLDDHTAWLWRHIDDINHLRMWRFRHSRWNWKHAHLDDEITLTADGQEAWEAEQ